MAAAPWPRAAVLALLLLLTLAPTSGAVPHHPPRPQHEPAPRPQPARGRSTPGANATVRGGRRLDVAIAFVGNSYTYVPRRDTAWPRAVFAPTRQRQPASTTVTAAAVAATFGCSCRAACACAFLPLPAKHAALPIMPRSLPNWHPATA